MLNLKHEDLYEGRDRRENGFRWRLQGRFLRKQRPGFVLPTCAPTPQMKHFMDPFGSDRSL